MGLVLMLDHNCFMQSVVMQSVLFIPPRRNCVLYHQTTLFLAKEFLKLSDDCFAVGFRKATGNLDKPPGPPYVGMGFEFLWIEV